MADAYEEDFARRRDALTLFSGVGAKALETVMADMEANLYDGDFVVRQGEKPMFLYIVLEGTVDIAAGPTPEIRVYIDSRGPGDVIGEQAYIEDKHHSADVKARGAVKILRIPTSVVRGLRDDRQFERNLLNAVSAKLRAATNQRYRVLAERQLLFSHFRSHVNPQIVDQLLNKGEAYGNPRRVDPAFIMFSDLRDFTRLSGEMSEIDVATELAPYFSALVDVVHETYGFVDKYIGDAVMAVWGHPALGEPSPDDVLEACFKMLRRAADLTFGGEPVRVGIGLNAGSVFMGNVGTLEKRSFTVLGDAVNFAARYEGANKAADGQVYPLTVGPAMFELLNNTHQALFVQRPETKIKGAPGNAQTVYSLKEAT
jgi:class 3 adenylate cyclase